MNINERGAGLTLALSFLYFDKVEFSEIEE